jgi:diguanylate cyclase
VSLPQPPKPLSAGHIQATPPPLVYRSYDKQKTKRLIQILRITQIALLVVSIITFSLNRYGDSLFIFATALFLFTVDWLVHKRRHQLAASVLLISLTVMLSILAWEGSGIRDTALIGFCGVLTFSVLIGSRNLLIGLSSLMILVIFVIGLVNQLGYHINPIAPINLSTGTIAVVILIVVTLGLWFLAQDYSNTLEELAYENELVKKAKNHIEHLALHDPLTGLANRALALENFNKVYTGLTTEEPFLGIIFIDLDNLKPINDSLGHHAGDQILKEAALRLLGYAKRSNLVCRYGGDEFIIFLPNIKTIQDASQASHEILQLVSEHYHYRGIEILCTCSIGIAIAPKDGNDLDTLIKKANIAMYHSKDSGRNSFRFFNANANIDKYDHISLISGMRKGLQENQFSLYYQPKIDLRTNEIRGFEALLRWNHPEQGFISPITFIPLAESSGLIIQLGAWVIHEACRQAALWISQGMSDFSIAVNISSIQFKRGDLDTLVLDALTSTGLPANYLELEFTESLLIEDSERLNATLNKLSDSGVHFSIDDFGTGYSNLGYLKKFKVSALKIDRSFISKMDDDSGDAAIVRAIIQMATSLGINTIAEGVEDALTAAILRNLGCTQAQGYLWAKPLPANQIYSFCESYKPSH